MTEPIELSYTLHLLAPGRIGFRRWRWELWDGQQLAAAGWRVTAHPLRPEAANAPESPWRGRPVTVDCGALSVRLTPRAIRERHPQVLPASG
jgi:hypothetical protein